MRLADAAGILITLLAGLFWFVSRWAHEILRCLRQAESAGAPDCQAIVEWPLLVFRSWLALLGLGLMWSFYLLRARRPLWAGLTAGCVVLAFVAAASWM